MSSIWDFLVRRGGDPVGPGADRGHVAIHPVRSRAAGRDFGYLSYGALLRAYPSELESPLNHTLGSGD